MPLAPYEPRTLTGAPWEVRGLELEEKEGHWCFYAAWEELVRKDMDAMFEDGEASASFDDLDTNAKTALYCLMLKPYLLAAKGE
jgi:hypothetical protein